MPAFSHEVVFINILCETVPFQRETVTVDIPKADSDSVRVWVRATDATTLCCVSERDIVCGHPERGR